MKSEATAPSWTVRDHGVIVPISEVRGALLANVDDTPLLIAVLADRHENGERRASLLVVDLGSGESNQYFYPDRRTPNGGSPFCVLMTSRDTFCYMAKDTFVEFDLRERAFRHVSAEIEGLAMSMVEADDGRIYVATYPDSLLFEYDPIRKSVRRLTQLDSSEKYPRHMAVGKDGWIYAGLGTAKANLVAYHPEKDRLRQIFPEDARKKGEGRVKQLKNGAVVGRLDKASSWRLLDGGALSDVTSDQEVSEVLGNTSVYWSSPSLILHGDFEVVDFDLASREIQWKRVGKEVEKVIFEYESLGASISSIADGGNGRLLGSTEHPNQIWSYDIEDSAVELLGAIPALGGGNLTRMIRYGDSVISNSYSKGHLYLIDTTKPIVPQDAARMASANPRLLAVTHPHIGRPRCTFLHQDGKHVISTGFPGYGDVGGGMLIYDLDNNVELMLLDSSDLLPGHSITAIVGASNDNLLLGTSILTPGGGTPTDKEATIVEFDWETKTIMTPFDVPVGSDYILSMALEDDHFLHVVTDNGFYLLYDLNSRELLTKTSLTPYGGATGKRGDTAFCQFGDGRLFLITKNALLEVDQGAKTLRLRAEFPLAVTDAGPYVNGRLYLAANSHLLSVNIPDLNQ